MTVGLVKPLLLSRGIPALTVGADDLGVARLAPDNCSEFPPDLPATQVRGSVQIALMAQSALHLFKRVTLSGELKRTGDDSGSNHEPGLFHHGPETKRSS